jgi:hypothetical protein
MSTLMSPPGELKRRQQHVLVPQRVYEPIIVPKVVRVHRIGAKVADAKAQGSHPYAGDRRAHKADRLDKPGISQFHEGLLARFQDDRVPRGAE